jgi:antitoxin FitA
MDEITIHDLDDAVIDRLRVRAVRNGRSLEAEVLAIIGEAVGKQDEPENFLMA